jgi:phage tail-like protein
MAFTKEQIKKNYPLPVYNYRVDIGTTSVSFSEVSGLDRGYDVITYKESYNNSKQAGPHSMNMPGMRQATNITLKKGYVKGVSIKFLYDWIDSIQLNLVDKKDIIVHLLDEAGSPVVSWKCVDAFPTKLTGPSFNANSNEVAIESMELRVSRLVMNEE